MLGENNLFSFEHKRYLFVTSYINIYVVIFSSPDYTAESKWLLKFHNLKHKVNLEPHLES